MLGSQAVRRIALVIAWLAATAGVAYVVASAVTDGSDRDILEPLPVVSLDQRPTTSLASVTILPNVAADGVVQRDGDTFLLSAPIDQADLAYRLLAEPIAVKALIQGGPAGFACSWRDLGEAAEGGVAARCEIPADVPVAEGMTGTMVIQTAPSQRAQALPLTAVIGSEESGQVIVITNGVRELRNVSLGAADDLHVEITAGLDPGETVLEFPTQIDVSAAAAQ